MNAKIILSVVLIVGAVGFLLADSLADPETLTYFRTADQVMSSPDDYKQTRFRMGGYVKDNSILQKPGTLEYQFEVSPKPMGQKDPKFGDRTITVRYTGVVPDTFKDKAEVIVGGKLAPDGSVFMADELVAKCPSKYEAQEKEAGTY